MSKTHVLLAFCLLAAVSSVAAGDDAKTYRLVVRDHWKPGDTVTRTAKETDHQMVKVELPDGTIAKDETTDTSTTSVRVEKCTEADADGRWAKGLVRFVEWTRTKGETKDESLKGVVIELAGAAGKRAWKPVTEGAKPTEAAKAWVDKSMGPDSHHDLTEEIMDPKKEVAVGETWPPDVAAFAEMLSKQLAIDVEKSDCKVTLKAVEGPLATLALDYKLATKGLPNAQAGTTLPWVEGGTLTMRAEAVHAIDGSVGGSRDTGDHAWSGVAEDPTSKVKVRLELAGHQEGTETLGGEIPESQPK